MKKSIWTTISSGKPSNADRDRPLPGLVRRPRAENSEASMVDSNYFIRRLRDCTRLRPKEVPHATARQPRLPARADPRRARDP